jgi:hypothetical protein
VSTQQEDFHHLLLSGWGLCTDFWSTGLFVAMYLVTCENSLHKECVPILLDWPSDLQHALRQLSCTSQASSTPEISFRFL